MSAAPRPAEWTRRAERGSVPLIRCMAWLSLAIGRPTARVLLRAVTLYFWASGGAARRASHAFLARALGRAPTWREGYGHFLTFATTLHDRLYFLRDRFDLFDVRVIGTEHLDARGTLLMGAHFGSFEALRACGRHLGKRRVVMAMYADNARKVNSVLEAISPGALADVVALGRMDSMLELTAHLEDGALVGVLADRTPGGDAVVEMPFLGAPAAFPTGPMRMAAALRQRVVFMAGVHLGGNRYEIRFEPLADFGALPAGPRAGRDAMVRGAIAGYVQCLERHVRGAPANWANFFAFWERRA